MRKTVKQQGNGAMVLLPKSWIGRTVEIKIVPDYSHEENLEVLQKIYENETAPKSVFEVQRKLMITLGRTNLLDEEMETCQVFFDSF